jgi:hypothetical protein
MKNFLRNSLWMLLLAALFSSCSSKAPKEAKYIPKDASFVFIADPQQMQDKLQKGGISVDSLIARLFKNEPVDSKDRVEFDDFTKNAGIDWSGKFFVFVKQKIYPDKSTANTFNVLASLKDASKLEAFVQKHEEFKDKKIQKEKDFSYILQKDGTLLSWNKDQLIVSVHSHQAKMSIIDTATGENNGPRPFDLTTEVKQEVTAYYTQKASESMADVKPFTNMFKDKADGYMFSSSNSAMTALSMLPFQIPKLEELVKDNYSTATFSFEDGRIVGKSTAYLNPMITNLMKQYSGPTVDLSLIENFPSSRINGFMLFAMNPAMIGGLLKQLEVEGLVNNAMQKAGFTSEDIYKAFKGDMALAVSDLGMMGVEPQMKTDERSMMTKRAWGKLVLNLPIGDKAAFNKIMDKGVEMGVLVRQSNSYKTAPSIRSIAGVVGMDVFIQADDKGLVIASDSLTYTQYMAKTTKAAIDKDLLAGFKGKTSAVYFDIATTLGGFIKDSSGKYSRSLMTAKNTFRDVIGSTDQLDGNTIKSNFEVRMQDQKQNSLVTLTRLCTDIAVDMRLQAKKDSDEKAFPAGVPAIIRTN